MAGYQTGTGNRLLNDGTYSYQYDDEGNRTKRTKTATGEVTEYEWDFRNRLTKVTEKDASGNVTKVVEYTYDVFNRRIAKEVDTTSPFDMQDAAIERYVYDDIRNGMASLDGGNVVLDFVDSDGPSGSGAMTLAKRYLWGEQVDELLAQEDVTKTISATDRVLWPIVDHLGTVRDLVNGGAAVAEHFEYDAFGRIVSGDTSLTRYLFTSREFDADTGLQYHRARWYDPAVGRWVSEDPLGFAAGDANTGRYVGNGTTAWLDPSGLTQDNAKRQVAPKDTDVFTGPKGRALLDRFNDAWNASAPDKPNLRYEVAEWIIIRPDPRTGKPISFKRWPWNPKIGRRHGKWDGPLPQGVTTFFHTHPFPGNPGPSKDDLVATDKLGRPTYVITEDYIFIISPLRPGQPKHERVIGKIERTDPHRKKAK